MYFIKIFATLVILLTWSQSNESKVIESLSISHDNTSPIATIALVKNDLISVKDVWQKVKNSILIAWNRVKVVANNFKTKISIWIAKEKVRVEEINKAIEEKLINLKKKTHDVINKVFGDGKTVRKCIKQEAQIIENKLNDLIQQTTSCFRNNLGSHSMLRTCQKSFELNETELMDKLESKLSKCEKDSENHEICLYEVREDILNNIDDVETNLYRSFYSKIFTDNLQDALVTCTMDGLIEASSIAATEVLKITKCVIQESRNNTEVSKQYT